MSDPKRQGAKRALSSRGKIIRAWQQEAVLVMPFICLVFNKSCFQVANASKLCTTN